MSLEDGHWQNPPSRSAIMAGFLFLEKSNNPENFFCPIFDLTNKTGTRIIRV